MINRTGSIHFFRLMLVAVLLILLTGCSSIEASSSMPTETTHSDESFPELEELGAIEGDTIIEIEVIIILMLMTALLVNIAANKLRIPYTVGLVLVGLGLTLIDGIPVISVSPELILALLVPPLVFEAAYHIDFNDMRRDLKLILVLAIPGVVLTTFLVGGVVSLGAGGLGDWPFVSFPGGFCLLQRDRLGEERARERSGETKEGPRLRTEIF